MATDADVLHALLHEQGRSVAELAAELGMTRQHTHRLLTGRRNVDVRAADLDRALALGPRPPHGVPAFALATLADGRLELVPAGDTLPLFASRGVATVVAAPLQDEHSGLCAVPVWPAYAWRHLVAFHAAWGVEAEPRKIFLVDDSDPDLPLDALLGELRAGFAETLRLRALGDDPTLRAEVERRVDRLH